MSLVPPITLGSLTSVSYLVAQVSGNTQVPLGEAVAGFVFVAGLVAWLSRKLQKIEDDVADLKRNIATRPCQRDAANCPRIEPPSAPCIADD